MMTSSHQTHSIKHDFTDVSFSVSVCEWYYYACAEACYCFLWARLGLIRESNEIRGVGEGGDALMDARKGMASQ